MRPQGEDEPLLRDKITIIINIPEEAIENASASAFPVACCGVSERTTIIWIHSLHFEDSLQLAAGSFNSSAVTKVSSISESLFELREPLKRGQ